MIQTIKVLKSEAPIVIGALLCDLLMLWHERTLISLQSNQKSKGSNLSGR
jgi:hypothetical protein